MRKRAVTFGLVLTLLAALPGVLAAQVARDNGPPAPGRAEGRSAANAPSTTGWLARGFVGGLLLGPIGTGIAVGKAAAGVEEAATLAAGSLSAPEPDYAIAWRQAYAERLRMRRQRSALLGGAVGTGIFVFALVQLVDLGGVTENDEVGDTGTPLVVSIPFRW